MVLTQPTHTILMKGGGCHIQFMVRLTKQFVLTIVNVTIFTLFCKMTDIVNSVINGNPSLNLNPEKCIMRF